MGSSRAPTVTVSSSGSSPTDSATSVVTSSVAGGGLLKISGIVSFDGSWLSGVSEVFFNRCSNSSSLVFS